MPLQHPLDALLEKLTSEYVDDDYLSARIRAVFQARARLYIYACPGSVEAESS